MNDPIPESSITVYPFRKERPGRWRWLRYLILAVLLNGSLWSVALFYLKVTKPTYLSQWALILPGSGPGLNVNLPNIGQATSQETSPFGSSAMDPRANYQYLITSEGVLAIAARAVRLPEEEFGKPRAKLVDNTTILQFEITGRSPREAQKKAYALNNALNQTLKNLRSEEIVSRDQGTQSTLESAKAKVDAAQGQLAQYKINSGLNSPEQMTNLGVNIEQLRKQYVELMAQQQQASQRLQQLSVGLRLTPTQATDAFVLQADQIFQLNLKNYSESSTNLEVLLQKWGPNHPQVVKEVIKQKAAKDALLRRSEGLLNRPITEEALASLQLGSSQSNASSSGREQLFQQLVTAQSEQKGIDAEVKTLNQQIVLLEQRLSDLTQKAAKLDRLQRDLQIAEAVFASTVTKLDLGKSSIYSSYPLIQLLRKPTLEDTPVSPKTKLVLAGAGASSLFTSTGLLLLWLRKHRLRWTPSEIHKE
jgi:uncharacterized protein involved in exopolysaccharide biosynthesis